MATSRAIVCDQCGTVGLVYSKPDTARTARARLRRSLWQCDVESDTCPPCTLKRRRDPMLTRVHAAGGTVHEVAELALCSVQEVRAVLGGVRGPSMMLLGALAAVLDEPAADVRAELAELRASFDA